MTARSKLQGIKSRTELKYLLLILLIKTIIKSNLLPLAARPLELYLYLN